jgi:hypothetical protein
MKVTWRKMLIKLLSGPKKPIINKTLGSQPFGVEPPFFPMLGIFFVPWFFFSYHGFFLFPGFNSSSDLELKNFRALEYC